MAKKTPAKKHKASVRQVEPEVESHSEPQPKPPPDERVQIVGIGGAEGGLEPLTTILRALPEDTGMAFVCVHHLEGNLVDDVTELLRRESKMPVVEARTGMQVERNQVYVIPLDTSISLVDGRLTLGPRHIIAGELTTIDTFFRSLALDSGPRAIGVLLSGSAADGPLGLKAIKAAGGITLVQDPKTAGYDGMPRSAITSGSVDFIRSPEEIAHELVLVGKVPVVDGGPEMDVSSLPGSPETIGRILTVVRAHTGVDFANYKPTTVKRRVLRRMVLRHIDTPERYLDLIRSDPAEVRGLYDDILINVTEFFRDPDAYAALREQVFPQIIANHERTGNRSIRLWIPGCSTGEEVYSLAIVLLEFLGDRVNDHTIQIFATDLSETALEKARTAIYPRTIAQNVSAERLRRFFVKADSGYQIHKRMREMCVFARHNLTRDPPFSKLDLVSCRNVLIYLGPVLQERVIPVLHYALNPGGFLILGTSEGVGAHQDLFLLMDKKNKIYARKPAPMRLSPDFSLEPVTAHPPELWHKPENWSETDVQREADRIVLSKFGPPGVVIDDDDNIMQFRGQTSQFLEPASGTASLNLLWMLKEGLAVSVKKAVFEARKLNAAVTREGIPFASADGLNFVDLEVIPFRREVHRDRMYLVLFERSVPAPPPPSQPGEGSQNEFLQTENAHLRQELNSTREYLQSIIEDQEAAHEELRSAAEEIQSSNEELQTTNEELESAKEELQSSNEELNTVNEELQTRNLQLSMVGNDLTNILANVSMPILILGNDLRIRRFTPITEKVLNLIPADVGRQLRDLNLRIPIPDPDVLLTDVLENLTPKALEVRDPDGRRYSLRIRPYRTEENKIDGLVLVFIDVDPVMRAMEAHIKDEWPVDDPKQSRRGPVAAALLVAQEDERRRLARELHDEFNQKLALLELTVQGLENRMPTDDVRRQMVDVRRRVADLSDDLRRIAYQLHPSILDDLGLVPALQQYCEELTSKEGIQAQFTHQDVPVDLPANVRLALYRVAQESLHNAAKHSGAKIALVNLVGSDSKIELTVRDGGSGFNVDEPRRKGLGMVGMQERIQLVGGSIEWKSKPGEGTTVLVNIPLTSGSHV